MSGLTSMFNTAMSLSKDMQNIQDNLTSYVREGVNSKIGTKMSFRTSTGVRELIELGPMGSSTNTTKVRCLASNTDFVMKRLKMRNAEGLGLKQAMAEVTEHAQLVAHLPDNAHLVRCFGEQDDKSGVNGLCDSKLILLELCGESLATTIAKEAGGMEANEVLNAVRDIADGLLCLHSAEKGPIVHGSLEPEHIFKDTNSGMWKLGSFGATHKSLPNDSEDTASDIWQLGILVLTMMFGTTSFCKENMFTMDSSPSECILASIPEGRPLPCIEGRILLLVQWLLAANPSDRPSIEQVVLAAGHLGTVPTPQLGLAFPASVRKEFKSLCLSLVRRPIFKVVDETEGSDRRILINKYGEEALRSPDALPAELKKHVKEHLLSAEASEYVQTVQSFMVMGTDVSLTPEAKKLSEELARLGKEPQQETQKATTESPKKDTTGLAKSNAPPMDLLGADPPAPTKSNAPPVDLLGSTAPTKSSAPPIDLLGSTAPTKSSAPPIDLLGSTAPTTSNAAPVDLLCSAVPAAAAQTEATADFNPKPGSCLQDRLADLYNAPAQVNRDANRFAALGAPSPQQMPGMQQQNAFTMPMANPYGFPATQMPGQMPYAPQAAPWQSQCAPQAVQMPRPMPSAPQSAQMPGQMPAAQQPKQVESKKMESKDPFAGIDGLKI